MKTTRNGTTVQVRSAHISRPMQPERIDHVSVHGGRHAYIWIGGTDGGLLCFIDGRETLREIAEAILWELDRDHRRKPREP